MVLISAKRKQQLDLLRELVRTNFKLRYNDSFLGFIWVFMNPFFRFLILYVVFTALRGDSTGPNYGVNLLIGIILFTFVSEGILLGMKSLLDKAAIILKIDFPRYLAVVSSLMVALINLFINTVIILVIILIGDFRPDILGVIYFLGIVSLMYMMFFGISLITSVLLVKIRDLDHIMDLVMQLLFWGSGVMYSIDEIQGRFGTLIRLNPFAIMIDAARKALVDGEFVHTTEIGVIVLLTILIFIVGQYYFKKEVKKIAEFV